ncbi:FAD-binding oxidoreductase [Stygiolobus azoricus]|nr:FAD-binding oxidoreductase [Stygiolobus azoricus]
MYKEMSETSIFSEFERELGKKVSFDKEQIAKYSVAPYVVSPILSKLSKGILGIVNVFDEDDLRITLQLAYKHNIPLVLRGRGTSTIGQVIPLKPSIIVDISNFSNTLTIDKDYVTVYPGNKVIDVLKYLRKRGKTLKVYPSSLYISTIGGYISGGDVGIGSFQFGYHFHAGIRYLKVLSSDGKTIEVRGIDTLGFAQAAGTNGAITEAEISIMNEDDWKDQLVSSDNLIEILETIKILPREKVRRVTIEDSRALSLVGRLEGLRKWNLIVSSTLKVGNEINAKFLDELAFAAAYVTFSKISNFKNFFYEVRLLSLEEFYDVVSEIKKSLGDEVMIHGDVMTLRGKIIIYTVFMSEKSNFRLIEDVMRRKGIPFEIHSIYINDRVDEPERLELMKKYKRLLDPKDILNPGKLRLDT